MAVESRVQELLDEISDSGRTPEEVCVACPELLPEVRRRWQQMCAVKADLHAPSSPRPAWSMIPESHTRCMFELRPKNWTWVSFPAGSPLSPTWSGMWRSWIRCTTNRWANRRTWTGRERS